MYTLTAHQLAAIEAERARLHEQQQTLSVCKDISAFVGATVDCITTPGARSCVPHWFNLVVRDGALWVLDASADQFGDDGVVVYGPDTDEYDRYTWFDRARYAAACKDGPVDLDPVFDEHGLWRPLREHPARPTPCPFYFTVRDVDLDGEALLHVVELWHRDRQDCLRRSQLHRCYTEDLQAEVERMTERHLPRRFRPPTYWYTGGFPTAEQCRVAGLSQLDTTPIYS